MAKYECSLQGDFDQLLRQINSKLLDRSQSATYEDGSDYELDGVRCAVRVYERYSWMGGNRVSLNLTLVGHQNDLFVSAITSGGSQALFYKINTIGEKTFLKGLVEIIEEFKENRP